jgi:hypothetical protein
VLGVRARAWPHGKQQAGKQCREVSAADIGPHGAGPLGPAQQAGDLRLHVVHGSHDGRAYLNPCAGQRIEQVPLGPRLRGEPSDEREKGRARVGGVEERGAFAGQATQPVMHHRLEQRLLSREVTIQRPRSHAGALGYLIQRNGQAFRRERAPGHLKHSFPVPPGIGSQRPSLRHPTSRSHRPAFPIDRGRRLKAGRTLRYRRP